PRGNVSHEDRATSLVNIESSIVGTAREIAGWHSQLGRPRERVLLSVGVAEPSARVRDVRSVVPERPEPVSKREGLPLDGIVRRRRRCRTARGNRIDGGQVDREDDEDRGTGKRAGRKGACVGGACACIAPV